MVYVVIYKLCKNSYMEPYINYIEEIHTKNFSPKMQQNKYVSCSMYKVWTKSYSPLKKWGTLTSLYILRLLFPNSFTVNFTQILVLALELLQVLGTKLHHSKDIVYFIYILLKNKRYGLTEIFGLHF